MAALAVALLACTGFYSWWTQPPRQQARAPHPAAGCAGQSRRRRGWRFPPTQDPDDANHVVLNLAATEQVWLSITSSDGKQIFSGVLAAQPDQDADRCRTRRR